MPLPAPLFPACLDGRATVESRSSGLEYSGALGALRKQATPVSRQASGETPWTLQPRSLPGVDREPG